MRAKRGLAHDQILQLCRLVDGLVRAFASFLDVFFKSNGQFTEVQKWKSNKLAIIETRKSRDIQSDNDNEEKIAQNFRY